MTKKIPWYKKEINLLPVSTVDVVTMTQNMSVMLEAGLTVPESLEVLVEQSSGRLKSILTHVNREVQGGEMLGDALTKYGKDFGPIFVSAVKVGENSGTLAKNLTHVAHQMERDLEVRRNVQGAMLYPSIIVVATGVIGLALATFVLPQMTSIFESLDVELPWSTRALIWMSKLFQDHGAVVTPLIFFSLAFLIWFLRRRMMQPIVHRVILHLPLIKTFVHEINRARFCRSIGTMLQSGVPIQESLSIIGNAMPNYVYRLSIIAMHERIESGDSFAQIVEEYPHLYPNMVQRMIAVGERSGGLADSLLYLARFYEQKVAIKAKNISTIIEPLLLIAIGIAVAFVALSIFTPIYSITDGLDF
jgi:type II secretory pathway component PulF